MLKRLIIIAGGKKLQCDSEQEVVKGIISEDYYQMSPSEKKSKMKLIASAALINRKDIQIEDKESLKKGEAIDNKILLLDERSFILSLLINSDVTLLEHTNSGIYTGGLDKSQFTKNYIIVNNFAKKLLQKHIDDYYKRQEELEER